MNTVTKKTTINLILKQTYTAEEGLDVTDGEVEEELTRELFELFTVNSEDIKVDVLHIDVEYKDWLEH